MRDREGPQLVAVRPAHLSTGQAQPHVVFRFNEYLDRASAANAVFISPLPEVPPQIWVHNRQLHVRFRAPLPPATTGVISIGTGLRDFNEKNPMAEGFTYAFSSGIAIDTGQVRGQLRSAFDGSATTQLRVLLYDQDSVAAGYWGRKPRYAADVDSGGAYWLPYLRPGRYRILAVADKDNSYTWNQPTEAIGARPDNDLVLDSTAMGWLADLTTWVPDDTPPRLLSALALHTHTLTLRFSEPLSAPPTVLLGTDTLPAQWAPEGKPELVRLTLPMPIDTATLPLQLRALTDTAGNRIDTLTALQLEPWQPNPRRKEPAPIVTYAPPATAALPTGLAFLSRLPIGTLRDTAAHVQVRSLEGDSLPWRWVPLGSHTFGIALKLAWGDSVRVTLQPSLPLAGGARLDTTLQFVFLPQAPERYGTLQLTLHTQTAPLLLELLNSKGQAVRRMALSATGAIPIVWDWLQPDTYHLRVVEDTDGSGSWTPPRLLPWRDGERVHRFSTPMPVRASWEMDGLTFAYPPVP